MKRAGVGPEHSPVFVQRDDTERMILWDAIIIKGFIRVVVPSSMVTRVGGRRGRVSG